MTQILYGRHPVLAALRHRDLSLEEVYLAQGLSGAWVGEITRLARSRGVRLRTLPKAALDRLTGSAHHQGVAARRAEFVYASIEELLARLPGVPEPPLLVAADGLTDPMNLGNLARSALAAGAHGLLIPKDRAVGVTATVLKAAAGALEILPVCRVTNLAEALLALKEQGLLIVGTDARAPQDLYGLDLTLPLVLVIGGEDKGLRLRVRRCCDVLAAIPMASEAVSSLNAAAAGAVALFEARRQRLAKGVSSPAAEVSSL
ncbi:MAG: 23S rRNA (guanosine(2251)-2'-O)-methyltransferase RlmB [Syntrophobacterales bacterium]|nr:23S rRNA (guanosine(2251)-2'-O)-methyltransferase RlmB [Syntrophobacterales bacterium]